MIHIEATGVDGLLARAVTSTDHVHLVDGGSGREETYDRFAEALVLPEHFGRNLDALMDCLRDVADRHEGPSPGWVGREARQRTANPCTRVQIPYPPRAVGAVGSALP